MTRQTKLETLCEVAEAFVASRSVSQFSRVSVRLKWEYSDGEAWPIVEVELVAKER